MRSKLKNSRSEYGATLIEYVLTVSMVAVVAIPAIDYAGNKVRSTFEEVSVHGLSSESHFAFGGGTEGTVGSGDESTEDHTKMGVDGNGM